MGYLKQPKPVQPSSSVGKVERLPGGGFKVVRDEHSELLAQLQQLGEPGALQVHASLLTELATAATATAKAAEIKQRNPWVVPVPYRQPSGTMAALLALGIALTLALVAVSVALQVRTHLAYSPTLPTRAARTPTLPVDPPHPREGRVAAARRNTTATGMQP